MSVESLVSFEICSQRSRGNKRAVSEKGGVGACTLVPVFGTREHPHVPSFRFLVPGNIRMYPHSGFWYWGISAKPPQGARLRGRTPQGGRSRHFLETLFSEPLLRTLLRTLFTVKPTAGRLLRTLRSEPFSRTLSRTISEPFLERCVAVRPLRRAPYTLLETTLSCEPLKRSFWEVAKELLGKVWEGLGSPGRFRNLVSRGRCGREIARLRRLAAVVAAIFLRF